MLPETRRLYQANQSQERRLTRAWAQAWPSLDPRHLDRSFDRWLAVVADLVGASRAEAAEAGLEYAKALGLAAERVTPDPLEPARFAISMHVTAVATAKRATATGVGTDAALLLALRVSRGAAVRHVLDAQRDVVMKTIEADGVIDRWKRVSNGPGDCDFCRMLIGRGAVYTEETVTFRSHDNCDCMVEPVMKKAVTRA